MNSKIKCGYANSMFLVWTCPCGYNTETDRAGLTHKNIIDKYQLVVNEGFDYDKVR
jgi:hypothetical protein